MALDGIPITTSALPVVVAGPVLRRLTRTEVSVWLACTEPDDITLTVTRRGTTQPVTATATPSRVGRQLWIAVLTAPAPGPGGQFESGSIYEYDITAPWSVLRGIEWSVLAPTGAQRPSFLGPPATVDDLVIFHTSCRKVHGGGRDALALADDVVNARFSDASRRQPHLLVMSGDQIYADEVGHTVAPRVRRVATDLIDIDETNVFGAPPPIGGRQAATTAMGFTTGAAANHLWTYGEFMAMYLLAWSPVLWPTVLPEFPTDLISRAELDPGLTEDAWNNDRAEVGRFLDDLPRVARVLANVPSLMIFDDHEVTDDWNLDHGWVNATYPNDTARRLIVNGVVAYTLCQHWGNVPAPFATVGSPERSLLEVVAAAIVAEVSPAPTATALLGVRTTALPAAPPAQVLRDLLAPGTIRYDFRLGPADGWPARLIFLDERLAREYTREDNQAARISRAALALQLPPPVDVAPLTIVVAAAPILGSDLVEEVIQPTANLLPGGDVFADYESWSAVTANHQDLLERLASYNPVVVLSGDVHYGFTARLERTQNGTVTRVAQLTTSAAKNVEVKTAAISMFSELIMRLGLERIRDYAGYSALAESDRDRLLVPPPSGTVLAWDDTVDVLLGRVARDATEEPAALAAPVAHAYGLPAPDWTYRIEPIDDTESAFAAPVPPAPWDGWRPDDSIVMAEALQRADLHRIGRMFVGLSQFSVITCAEEATGLRVRQELHCPVGLDGTPGEVHVLATEVALT